MIQGASLAWFAWVTVIENALMLPHCSSCTGSVASQSLVAIQRVHIHRAVARCLASNVLRHGKHGVHAHRQVMIKQMLDSEAVGNYAAAVQFSEVWYIVLWLSALPFPAT